MNQLSFSRSITDTHVRRFVGHHVEGLRNAAHVLGCDEGARLVDDLMECFNRAASPSRRTRRLVVSLHALLHLHNVHDESRAEAGYFAAIDPGDPVVEAICLLADGLSDAIEADLRRGSVSIVVPQAA